MLRPPISWSIELATRTLLRAGSPTAPLLAHLPAGTRVYLPDLPNDPPSAIEDALALVARANRALVPVPHVAAGRAASAEALEARLGAWQRATADGVREVLVVRGDDAATHDAAAGDDERAGVGAREAALRRKALAADETRAAFASSLELLETGALQRAGVETVALCGHPEGVGGLSARAARDALAAKLRWADGVGVQARVVTQFSFDVPAVTAFVDALRADGLAHDVSVGLVGPCTLTVRERVARRCGVAPPRAAFVTSTMRALARWQAARGAASGAQALHLYPFGGLGRTLRWLHDVAQDTSVYRGGDAMPGMCFEPPPPEPTWGRADDE